MPIKRIQLRGISRTPSDRMTEDGGCAESLNLRLDNTELAPIVSTKAINDQLDESGKRMFPLKTKFYDSPWEVVYLHKTQNYQRAILVYGEDSQQDIVIYNDPETPTGSSDDFTLLLPLEHSEKLLSVTSMGNLLLITTDQRTERLLYIDGAYKPLGDHIPFPAIEIHCSSEGTETRTAGFDIPAASEGLDPVYRFDTGIWNTETYTPAEAILKRIMEAASLVEKLRSEFDQLDSGQQKYSFPVFAKYSFRLYDGSEIASDAFLIYPSDFPISVMDATSYFDSRKFYAHISKEYFTLRASAKDPDDIQELIDNYSDIVKSVRFYISEDLRPDAPGTVSKAEVSDVTSSGDEYNATISLERTFTKDDVDKASNFYLLKEVELADMLSSVSLPYYNNTDRVVRQRLVTSTYNARNIVSGKIATSYNNRLLLADAKEKFNSGVETYPGFLGENVVSSWDKIQFWYFLNTDGGNSAIVEGNEIRFTDQSSVEYYRLASYITYSNPNCKKVVARLEVSTDVYYFEIAMREHPHLDMSYFIGLGHMGLIKMLKDVQAGTITVDGVIALDEEPEEIQDLTADSDTIERSNTLFLSSFSNPFVFEQSQQFSDAIVGVAPLTKPLSTGQVGQFAIYVFTLGGVHSIGIANDGSFANHALVSRDVCRYPQTIKQLDQAIVYLTDSGLMLMTGSDLQNISAYMNGVHYKIETDASNMLPLTTWGQFISILNDGTSFMEFMREAEIAYDYAGARLICFNKGKFYAYVYEFRSSSWHKISVGPAGRISWRTVNAYPFLWVNEVNRSVDYSYVTSVLDYSTFLEDWSDTAGDPVYGVQITRPFDLDEPDMRKCIKAIKIRGHYNKNDVKYMLLGSQDGLTFNLLHSLRGGSWKLFRMILLTKLSPGERVSWIDVDYETRFTNKLR